jgi:hypothetical protein
MGVNRQTKEGLSFSIILGPPFLKNKDWRLQIWASDKSSL